VDGSGLEYVRRGRAFRPHKIRLLRKAGRVGEAQTLAVDCALNGTSDVKRACREANQIPAGRAQR